MKAVWSHWTKPLRDQPGAVWISTRHYLMSFVLSFYAARRHFPHTSLFTDREGEQMLVEHLGLPFSEVHVELDALNHHCLYWWNLGKLHAYRAQTEPFIHLDNDVFLWEPLPPGLLAAPVFAQNPEYFSEESDYYLPRELEEAVGAAGGWFPEEWLWCRRMFGGCQRSINTGIYGGWRTDFIRYCADLTLHFLQYPRNVPALLPLDDKARHAGMLEMFLPAACALYHRCQSHSPFHDISIECLFASAEDAYDEAEARGYTHLLGRAKRDPHIVVRMEERVRREHPEFHRRCVRWVEEHGELCQAVPTAEVSATPT